MALISIPNIYYAACAFIFFVIGLWIYRAFFDSLSKFPGPKLAAASLWYEFYYDVVKKGQYTWEIGRMHEKYGKSSSSVRASSPKNLFLPHIGPIVRISPYEIHIDDPEFVDSVFPGSSVRNELV